MKSAILYMTHKKGKGDKKIKKTSEVAPTPEVEVGDLLP